jgi:hypothetical protein
VDQVGGALDAVQGRLLRAKLDALRFTCHSGTSFPQLSLLRLLIAYCTVNVRT